MLFMVKNDNNVRLIQPTVALEWEGRFYRYDRDRHDLRLVDRPFLGALPWKIQTDDECIMFGLGWVGVDHTGPHLRQDRESVIFPVDGDLILLPGLGYHRLEWDQKFCPVIPSAAVMLGKQHRTFTVNEHQHIITQRYWYQVENGRILRRPWRYIDVEENEDGYNYVE